MSKKYGRNKEVQQATHIEIANSVGQKIEHKYFLVNTSIALLTQNQIDRSSYPNSSDLKLGEVYLQYNPKDNR